MVNKAHKDAAARRAAALSDDEHAHLYAALTQEKAGYVARGLDDRAAQVDAQLKALGKPKPSKPSEEKAEEPPKAKSTTRRGSAKAHLEKAEAPHDADGGPGDPAADAAGTGATPGAETTGS